MDDARVALQVTSGIQTRAYDDQWEKGDEIGIFGFTQGDAPTQAYTNERYVTTGGNDRFTPGGTPIYLPTDDSYLDFVAYYPHTTSLTADGEYGGVQLRAQAVEDCLQLHDWRWHG